jgi:hypothetical protein
VKDFMPRNPAKSKELRPKKTAKAATVAAEEVVPSADTALALFHPITAAWFRAVFDGPTAPQREGWPAIARGESTLILAPTGTGKTLTAFLWCLDKLMMQTPSDAPKGCRVVYISPLKPPLAAARHRQYGPARRRSLPHAGDQRPHRRHLAEGTRTLPKSSRRHPDHHARVALSPAHF